MATVEKVRPEMYGDLYEFLLADISPEESEAAKDRLYRPLFETSWENSELERGFVLLQGGEVVGFIGTLFSARRIENREINLCNLTTWKVKEGSRSQSVELLFPILKRKEHIITGLSLAPHVYPVYKMLGFRDLETCLTVFAPTVFAETKDRVESVFQIDLIRGHLNSDEKIVLDDHLKYECKHAVFFGESGYVYVVLSLSKKMHIPCVYIHHISNKDFFVRHHPSIVSRLMTIYRAPFVVTEGRYLDGYHLPLTLRYRLNVPRMVKGQMIDHKFIDSLYSELIVLNLFRDNFF
jgi:hypothetical protein